MEDQPPSKGDQTDSNSKPPPQQLAAITRANTVVAGDKSKAEKPKEEQKTSESQMRPPRYREWLTFAWEWRKRLWEWSKRDTSSTDWIIVLFTGVIALVGILQWAVIGGQLKEMQAAGQQTDQLLSLYRKQVEKLGESIAETHALVEATAEAERPWIGEFGFKASVPLEADKPIRVVVIFKNGGKRPARVTEGLLSAYVYPRFTENPRYGKPSTKPSRIIVIPEKTYEMPLDALPISSADLREIENGSKLFCVYAIVRYEDVRKPTEPHYTKICAYYDPMVKAYFGCPVYSDAN